jgi:hypothetical protein
MITIRQINDQLETLLQNPNATERPEAMMGTLSAAKDFFYTAKPTTTVSNQTMAYVRLSWVEANV